MQSLPRILCQNAPARRDVHATFHSSAVRYGHSAHYLGRLNICMQSFCVTGNRMQFGNASLYDVMVFNCCCVGGLYFSFASVYSGATPYAASTPSLFYNDPTYYSPPGLCSLISSGATGGAAYQGCVGQSVQTRTLLSIANCRSCHTYECSV